MRVVGSGDIFDRTVNARLTMQYLFVCLLLTGRQREGGLDPQRRNQDADGAHAKVGP
jgi:hypothetical protein